MGSISAVVVGREAGCHDVPCWSKTAWLSPQRALDACPTRPLTKTGELIFPLLALATSICSLIKQPSLLLLRTTINYGRKLGSEDTEARNKNRNAEIICRRLPGDLSHVMRGVGGSSRVVHDRCTNIRKLRHKNKQRAIPKTTVRSALDVAWTF